MVSIKDIIREALENCESDVFYFDSVSDTGYHMHVFSNCSCVCFRQNEHGTSVISDSVFEQCVNIRCFLNSIGSESYYSHFKKPL